MRRFLFPILAGVFAALPFTTACADELTRQVQEELRRRYQYFGDIDGRPSEELASAIKSFQKRKGFAVSGIADAATTSSLGLQKVGTNVALDTRLVGAALPDVPILRSDAEAQINESDREFLRNLDVVAEGPPSPAAETLPAEPEPETEPAPAVALEKSAIEQFIREYLTRAEAETPEEELRFYADRVHYFDHGSVSRAFIETDVRRYYKRWPERKFTLLRMEVSRVSTNEATVNFRIRYNLKGKTESATGQTDNSFQVRRTENGFELTRLKEKRVRL